jgi:hypothetical protein
LAAWAHWHTPPPPPRPRQSPSVTVASPPGPAIHPGTSRVRSTAPVSSGGLSAPAATGRRSDVDSQALRLLDTARLSRTALAGSPARSPGRPGPPFALSVGRTPATSTVRVCSTDFPERWEGSKTIRHVDMWSHPPGPCNAFQGSQRRVVA